MEWEDVLEKNPLFLHLGGSVMCHPHPNYRHYVSVDLTPPADGWGVVHDLRHPLPLPDGCVDRLHTEDLLEHLQVDELDRLLAECHRVLKKDGMMRIACPDYNNPKDRPYADKGYDDRFPLHITFTTYALVRALIERSPFTRYAFRAYWDGDNFVSKPIDYSLGWVRRTPENDIRCHIFRATDSLPINIARWVKINAVDLMYMAQNGFRVSRLDMLTRPDRRLHTTSLVVDLFRG